MVLERIQIIQYYKHLYKESHESIIKQNGRWTVNVAGAEEDQVPGRSSFLLVKGAAEAYSGIII